MLTVLLIIACFYAVVWLVPRLFPRLLQWFVRRQMKKFFGETAGEAFSGGFSGEKEDVRGQNYEREHYSRHYPGRRRKKIDPTVGEYVEFTELSTSSSPKTERVSGNVRTENQISDIDWEDL